MEENISVEGEGERE